MASDYSKLDLYEHNQESYQKIKDAFKTKRVASIVHATGTGKSYNALQLALDNPDKKIVYLVPSNGIIEHLKKVIENNPNVDLNRDFKNIEFRTYQSLIRFSRKEIKDLKFDILITDELHHIGAPKWGNRVNELVRTHPDAKIFGMTAYTVRDRGTQYERDMTNSRTNELFSNSVVSKYDICDAMIDGLIPIPIYRSAYINLEQIGQKLETKLNALDPNSKEYKETSDAVKTCIKRIHEAKSIKDVIKTNIKKDGKGIYFCPPFSEKGVNDIDTIIAEAKTWFYDMGLTDDDFVIYKTTILMAQDGVDNRQAFYDDKTIDGKDASHKLRIMFAINQYNEGVHAPNVDFVIMGRGTSSDIVYFEQLGRALSVRGDTKKRFEELEKNSIEELIKIAKEKDIRILPTCEKEEIIQKLTSPVVIDLVNNYNFIKELENNLKDRIKEYSNPVSSHHRVNKINNVAFDIDITNQDIFNTLQQTFTRLYKSPEERWIDNLKLLEKYVKQGGDPNVPESCGLLELPDGEVELISKSNGNYVKSVKIGLWLYNQRCAYQKRTNPDFKTCNKPLTNEQVELLESVGVVFNIHDNQWIDNFRLLEKYVKQGDNPNVTESYGLLELPDGAVELISKSNGNYAKSVKIGNWLSNQRSAYQKRTNPNFKTSNKPLTNEQVELLENLGIFFNINDNQWMDNFRLLEKYVKQGGNLNSIRKSGLLELPNGKVELISKSNGNYDKSVKIGNWLSNQRSAYRKRTDPNIKTSNKPLTNEQIELLENLGIVFNINDKQWMDNFRLLERYVKQSGNFNFSNNYGLLGLPDGKVKLISPTNENYAKSIKIGYWLKNQRIAYRKRTNPNIKTRNKPLTNEQVELLENLGIVFNINDKQWMDNFRLLERYVKQSGNFNFSNNYGLLGLPDGKVKLISPTNENYAKSIKIGYWLKNQRSAYRKRTNPNIKTPNKPLTNEQVELLESVGVVFNIHDNQWMDNFRLLEKYVKQGGSPNIPEFYGLLELPNGKLELIPPKNENYTKSIRIGIWLKNQRIAYRKRIDPNIKTNNKPLTNEQVELLENLGVVLDFKKNININKSLCEKYHLKYYRIFEHMSTDELQAKISFLKSQEIPFSDQDGKPHELFAMSSINMKVKYGYSLEELVNKYLSKEKGRKL